MEKQLHDDEYDVHADDGRNTTDTTRQKSRRESSVSNVATKRDASTLSTDSTQPLAKKARVSNATKESINETATTTATRKLSSKNPAAAVLRSLDNSNENNNDNSNNNNEVVAITPISNHSKNKGEALTLYASSQVGASRRLVGNESTYITATKQKSAAESLLLSCIQLPRTVPNLFSTDAIPPRQCCCSSSTNSQTCPGQCVSFDFLDTYGWEYKTLLKATEDREYGRNSQHGDEQQQDDPLLPLVTSGIVPPLDKRRRQQTEWYSSQSIPWDLDDYMERQPDLAPRMRSILIDWIVELTEEYKLSPTTFHLAITLIDKSLACNPASDEEDASFSIPVVTQRPGGGFIVSRDMLQCLGCACTMIASKIEEKAAPSVDDFVYISDNIYRAEQIKRMEMDVCDTLKFRLQHVTPAHYAHEFLLASEHGGPPTSGLASTAPAFHPILHNMVYYLLELSRFSYELVPIKPSLVAAGAIFLARATLGISDTSSNAVHPRGYWTKTLQYYTGYSVEDIKSTVRIIHNYQRDAESWSLSAIFKKYNKSKFMYVSAKTVLNVEDLDLTCFMSNQNAYSSSS